jgi:tRNA-specific 2-thiouridylase
MRCNGSFRFAELLSFAERAGATRLATGHYARIRENRGQLLLARAADPAKDQSYMLARLDPGVLDRIWFPLGGRRKEETRADAAAAGLAAAGRAESQEACFLGGDDYRAFLERQGVAAEPGPIVDTDGTRLGTHAGHWGYTPGQRRRLGVSSEEPLYAVATVPASNTVVVGPRAALGRTSLTARGRLYVPVDRAEVKVRYRSPTVPATVESVERGFRLELDEPAYGVAPGQTAVLYEGDVVVGAGALARA